MFKFLTDDLREELVEYLESMGYGPTIPLDECRAAYDRLFEIVNLAIARAYAVFKEDAVIAVQLLMDEERERWRGELFSRVVRACQYPQ
jgi:hypothetical protein